jgi:hypothetical protein
MQKFSYTQKKINYPEKHFRENIIKTFKRKNIDSVFFKRVKERMHSNVSFQESERKKIFVKYSLLMNPILA